MVRWATPQLHDIDALTKMVDPALKGLYPVKSLSRFADVVALCVQVLGLSQIFVLQTSSCEAKILQNTVHSVSPNQLNEGSFGFSMAARAGIQTSYVRGGGSIGSACAEIQHEQKNIWK